VLEVGGDLAGRDLLRDRHDGTLHLSVTLIHRKFVVDHAGARTCERRYELSLLLAE
jgi:hypothetical protein